MGERQGQLDRTYGPPTVYVGLPPPPSWSYPLLSAAFRGVLEGDGANHEAFIVLKIFLDFFLEKLGYL